MNLNATIIGQAIAFMLFVLFCMRYVWPQLISIIEKRQKEISDGLDMVKSAKKTLETTKNEANIYLNKAKENALEIINQAKNRKSKIIHDAKLEAEQERSKILSIAKSELEIERQRIIEELRNQTAVLAIMCAEKIIERSIDLDTNKNIIDKVISEI